ncbi:MlaD family protein [Gordonia sp. CPCC 205333]|uniref:MlaD family protein n=1 Tax=Gordonia sp. CPCC 205333 TaxID=3140790 RepID=UPI003AF36C9D
MNTPAAHRSILRFTMALIVACIGLVGCGSTATVKLPGQLGGPTYEIEIEFANVLNIPDGAKVLLNGNRVGELKSVRLGVKTAITRVAISDGVRLPVAIGAELRQTTLLGDLYIALIPPDGRVDQLLPVGGRIPVNRTVPPDNVETVMTGLAQFINGGIVGRSQDVIRKLNRALPADPNELRTLTEKSARQMVELGASTDTLDSMLADGGRIVDDLAKNRESIERALVIGPDRFGRLQRLFLTVVQLIADLRMLTKPGGDLLVQPTYSDLKKILAVADPMLMTIADGDRSLGRNALAVRDLLAQKIAPFLTGRGEIDVLRVNDSNGASTRVADVLRAIGVV